MFTGQAGLSSSRHTKLLSDASDELRDSANSEQTLKRRVSHPALPPDVEGDPIRVAIRATAKSGPLAISKVVTNPDSTLDAMSTSEVIAGEEDVDVGSSRDNAVGRSDTPIYSGCGWKSQRGQMYMFE